MLTGLHGIDIITPGTSTVGYVQDFDTDSFGRFQFALNTASINAFYVWIDFPPKARFRIDMSWLTSLHSARRRLPTRLSWKNSSYCDNCGLAIQSDCKNTKIYWEKTRNGRKYKYDVVNLRLFKPNRFNISEILYKQMLFFITIWYQNVNGELWILDNLYSIKKKK